MGAPRGGSCNSNSCMKLSFEGRQSQSAIGTRSKMREWVPEHPQAAHSHLRVAQCGWTVRRKTSSPKQVGKDEERPMDFDLSPKQKEWLDRVQSLTTRHGSPRGRVSDDAN